MARASALCALVEVEGQRRFVFLDQVVADFETRSKWQFGPLSPFPNQSARFGAPWLSLTLTVFTRQLLTKQAKA
jgi:hypothetical protein